MADEVKDIESKITTEQRIHKRKAEDKMRTAELIPQLEQMLPSPNEETEEERTMKESGFEKIARKIIARERNTERAKRLAGIDSKTGLIRDVPFAKETKKKIELVRRDKTRGLIVALGDIDDFGIYNKLWGEHVGDMVLKALGPKLRGLTRQTDDVSRWGGEEFGFSIQYSKGEVDPNESVERIRTNTNEVEINKNGTLSNEAISLTFGSTKYEDGDTFASMFIKAANALKIAKLLGKRRTVVAEHDQFRDLSTNKIYLLRVDLGEQEILEDIQEKTKYRIEKSSISKARPVLVKLGS